MQASRAPTSSSKAFDFSVDVLPPLKLHESAYKIVEEEYSFAKPFTAAASYQSFIFENQDQTEFHFRKLVDSLARYSMVGFEKFFWSREETLDFYNQVTDNEFLHDKNRAILWNEFREKFRYLSEEHERSGADPCMFKAFEEEMQVESVSNVLR